MKYAISAVLIVVLSFGSGLYMGAYIEQLKTTNRSQEIELSKATQAKPSKPAKPSHSRKLKKKETSGITLTDPEENDVIDPALMMGRAQ